MRRVVVTGLGAVTPLGVGIRRTWANLLEGHTATTNVVEARGPSFDAIPSKVAGLVRYGSKSQGLWQWKDWGDRKDESRMATFTQYAVAAATEAIEDSGCTPNNDHERESMGVCIGSGIGSFEDVYNTSVAYENGSRLNPNSAYLRAQVITVYIGNVDTDKRASAGYRKVSPLFVPRLLINLAAGHVAMKFGLQGPNTSPTTACTTGAHAIGDAARFIALGDADVMLAGASESCIHPLALAGFARARSLSTAYNDQPQKASRPFDRDRDGFVIGEGAGVLVLEHYDRAVARKARVYAEVLGYGLSCDAAHMTSPLSNGVGAILAMQRALRQARVDPRDVDYVNAHATGTLLGDAAEIKAIGDTLLGSESHHFKEHARFINLSSTKGAIGHLLGAAGAVEAIFTILALHEGILPPTANLDNIFSINHKHGFSTSDIGTQILQSANFVPHEAQRFRDIKVALTNSFGFGGTNASLCFGSGPK